MTLDDESQSLADSLIAMWDNPRSNLLQILVELQFQLNHIPRSSIIRLAELTDFSVAQIEGVISFYSFLRTQPDAPYVFLFSDNCIEQMSGNRQLAQALSNQLGLPLGNDEPGQRARIDFTSCIGMSDQGPAAMVNGLTLTCLDEQRIEQIAQRVNKTEPVEHWPAEWFEVSANIQRKDNLLETPLEAGQAIRRAMELGEQCALDTIDDSGLRGCGGAGFKTGVKWSMCRDADGPDRVVVCNADEGEPGTFKDRLLLQHYADRLFEGMTVCSYTVGATRGFVYLRAEYRYMMADLQQILQRRREQNLLGENILGHRGFDFDIQIHLGAGAYICGEESALIESLEGKRGIPRNRPPFPTTSGYLHRPTVVNNVETLVLSAMIMAYGSSWFTASGTDSSPGTKLLSISGDCERPGIYEYPFGVSVQQVLDECGADKTQAVQIGGPSGSLIGQEAFNRRLSFDDLATGGSFMIFNQSRNLLDVIHNFTAFFEHESCGFCTPCRVGTTLLNKQLSKIMVGRATARDLEYIKTIGNLMKQSSHCGLGATAANPLLDSIQRFPLIYKSYLRSTGFEPSFDVDASLEEARQASGRNDPGAHLAGGGV